MDKIMTLWTGSGLFNLGPGQFFMICIGLLLLFLAIRKGFEPLLLVPIGFGGILANIPEAGLALSAAENAMHVANPDVLLALASVLDVGFQAGQVVTPEVLDTFKEAYKVADYATVQQAGVLAQTLGYTNGMLYNFYSVAIASGAAPLI
ncbi:MAG: sodium ion-translocating decarboxylase subunit beta, partial [Marinobacter sp.]